MGLRCFLFTSDGGSAETIGNVLATLDVEAESCSDATAAAEKIAHEAFQIVIIDWNRQPEAGLLLGTARERKASERPITLAIVSDDVSVPKALQAGANSILREPLVPSQIKDTLTTARDLVRSRKEPAATVLMPKPSAPMPTLASMEAKPENALRAGEFLQSGPVRPGESFVTESNVPASFEQPVEAPVDPLKELEPVASAVPTQPPPTPDEPKGLEWYLKAKGINRGFGAAAPAPAPVPAPARNKPDLLGFDQTPSISSSLSDPIAAPGTKESPAPDQKKNEAELFAYMDGEKSEQPRAGFRLGKGAIFAAFLLASIAIAAAPQAPWHNQLRIQWAHGQRALHAWLNPQPVTPPQAPATHESFERPGDEYKLPTAEAIPDATTDPSQIQVLPAVDPTAKKPNPDTANPDTASSQPNTAATPTGAPPSAPIQVVENQPSAKAPDLAPAVAPAAATATASAPVSTTPAPTNVQPAAVPAPKYPPYRPPNMPGNIPQSLKSQMAPNTPDPVSNRPADAAGPSIEPVAVAENAERALLIEQPPIAYPPNAKGQPGTVVLQVLIGRDGTVQDAKFLQGSLAFARTAIDGAKQWKFKPYMLNGHAVSVQTTLSITIKPVS